MLAEAGNSLVVVDFNATWCGPCQKIGPVFKQLALKYPMAHFVGVDVDRCRETAMTQGVSAMPTFIFYRKGTKVDSVRGANATELEEKIRKHYGDGEVAEAGPGGLTSVFQYIDSKGCECLNESDKTPFRSFLEGKSKIASDVDEQLIMVYGFNQNVKLQGFTIKAPVDNGPKKMKFFINQPKTLDFESAMTMTPTQEIVLSPEDLSGKNPVELRYVKFQSVGDLQIFIYANHANSDCTEIDSLTLYGAPLSVTNMQDFKRVAGKQGEAH